MTCYRYIELNPVRANIARKPGDYPWSSYHYNGSGECDSLVVPHPLYMRLGTTKEARLEAYQGLIRLRISGHELDSIREATNRAWLLGDEKFKNQIEALLDRQGFPLPRGGDRKSENYREKQRINRV